MATGPFYKSRVFLAANAPPVHLYAAFRSRATYSCRHREPWRVLIFSRFNWSAIFLSDLPVFLSR
jgi:hypothetical protein